MVALGFEEDILADNKISQNAGWDEELLKIEIADLQGDDFDVSLTGFEDYEITDLFAVHAFHGTFFCIQRILKL